MKNKVILTLFTLAFLAISLNSVSAYYYYTPYDSVDTSYTKTTNYNSNYGLSYSKTTSFDKSTNNVYLPNGGYEKRTTYTKTVSESPKYYSGYGYYPQYGYNYYPSNYRTRYIFEPTYKSYNYYYQPYTRYGRTYTIF